MNQLSTASRTITTTTLVLEQPLDYSRIEEKYKVERYTVPSSLQHNKNFTNYGRVHNAFRDQVNYPYRSYMYDKLDGEKNKKWVFYVLYPKEAEIIDITLPWFQKEPLQRKGISFSDLPLHMFLKLLQIRFFRGGETKRFVGHDKCYVYARSDKNDIHTCVEIDIKEAITNREDSSLPEFRVIPHAKRFGKAAQPYYPADPLFGKHAEGKQVFFTHLHSNAVEKEKTVYKLVNFKNSRAQLKYHDPHNLDAGKGKIVLDFLQAFLGNLADLGIIGHLRTRLVKPAPFPEIALLPVSLLGTVGVFDKRLNPTNSLSDYVDLFNTLSSSVKFISVTDITQAPQGGLIVLLDAKAEDFEDGGILFSQYEDPYPLLYSHHPEIPKHSLNVNSNDPDALDGGDYLDYSMLQPDDGSFQRKFEVILNELYLKCSIIYGKDTFSLPLIPNEMAFIRRDNYNSQKITVALWFEDNHIRFANLGDPQEREVFYNLAEKWGVDWHEQYEMLLDERRPFTESGTNKYKDLPSFDIIIGRNLFVAIDDLEESVLYDYEEISRRQQEQKISYPISYFRLSPHYDQIQKQRLNLLTLKQLSQQGLLDGSQEAKTIKAKNSLNFYKRLLEYDALLEEIEITHPSLSYRELTSGEWLERIAKIFGSKKSKDRKYRGKVIEGKYHSKLITGIYQDLDKFLSQKGKDVHLYQGIWYDDTNAFIVGSPNSMNIEGQERAHPIRRFQIIQGKDHFDKEQLLQTMGVQFVRHKQYTVSPYYFHLIDLYVENVLRYSF
jgi:hypothetical protein